MITIINNKFYLLETGVSALAGSDRVYQTDTEWVDWKTYAAHISVSMGQVSFFFLFSPHVIREAYSFATLTSRKPLWDMKQLVTCLRGSIDATSLLILYVKVFFPTGFNRKVPWLTQNMADSPFKTDMLGPHAQAAGFAVEEDLECGPDEKENSLKYASDGLCMVETWTLC